MVRSQAPVVTVEDYRRQLAESMGEKQFQADVVKLARTLGWHVECDWTRIHSTPGRPDLLLIRPPRVVFAELKREGGKLSPAQEETIALLRACGLEVDVWRPSDWDEIVEVLR